MININAIKLPVNEEMIQFDHFFKTYLKSDAKLLNIITNYILKTKGKQLRPLLVFLSAKLFSNSINKSVYHAAALIELMHTATLIHDDVVDDSHLRRSFFSINAIWKNKVAVLMGDYLLAKGLLLSIDNKEFDLLRIVSDAVKEMSEGELLQIEKARRLDISEELYMEIIRKKTSVLIAACSAAGAMAAGANNENINKMKMFGEYLGIAFQIRDDLFDYFPNKAGKPFGNDLREKKITLPLIYALHNANKSEKNKVLKIIEKKKISPETINKVVVFINSKNGFKYAENIMGEYKDKAINIINSFDDNEAKNSLIQLVEYTICREN